MIAFWTIAAVQIPPTLARGRNFFGAVGEFATPIVDWRVIAFTVTISACTVLLFGLMPALRATRTDLVTDLKVGVRASAASGRFALRESVVVLQLALAVVLIVGCGLLLTSYVRLRDTRLGFDPSRLLTFMIRPSEVTYTTETAPALIDRVLEEVGRVPGVEAATVDGCAPLSMQCASASLQRGRASVAATARTRQRCCDITWLPLISRLSASRSFAAAASPRTTAPDDRRSSSSTKPPPKRFWPNDNPIGHRVWFEGSPTIGGPDSTAEIVGIARNVAYQPLDEDPIQPEFFTPYAQFTYPTRMVLVRTRGEPLALVAPIAGAVRRADPALALFDVQTMEARARGSWSKHTFQTGLFLVIGVIALALAVTGVYAVTSYLHCQPHPRDRRADGARRKQYRRWRARRSAQTARLALVGGTLGVLGAVALSRIIGAALHETSPLDPGVFAGAVVVLMAAVIAASYFPLRRALRVNPVDVLRSE